MDDEAGAARLQRLEGEVALLRVLVARLAAAAEPRARIAIVKALATPASLAASDGLAVTPEMTAAAKSLLSLISR